MPSRGAHRWRARRLRLGPAPQEKAPRDREQEVLGLTPSSAARLIALGAIWGASFLFQRIVAPALGPVLTADLRMLIAGLSLAVWFYATGFDPQWRRWGLQYALVGMLMSGIPFMLYAYAALRMTAGQLALLNATSPMWGAILSAVLLDERLRPRRIAGLVLGIVGVMLITPPERDIGSMLALAACLGATFLYGFTGVYLRRWARDVPARGMAMGSQVAAGLIVLPLAALAPPAVAPTVLVASSILALGLVCGAIGYVLYFRLVADIGPTGALTVTYLTPAFGMLWGMLFLAETITAATLAGAALVTVGTLFVLRN